MPALKNRKSALGNLTKEADSKSAVNAWLRLAAVGLFEI